MSYRTIHIAWLPANQAQWAAFSASRKEAARLWGDLVEHHFRIRRSGKRFPTKARWQKWAKKKYPGLHSQSTQQIISEFCEAIVSASQLRKNGHSHATYPHRKPRYKDVVYTNQAVKIQGHALLFPNGNSGRLTVRIPKTIQPQGRLMEARICYGKVILVYEIHEPNPVEGPTIGIDLGVNTLIAATDGEKAVLVSGREAKATIQWRNKRLASLNSRMAHKERGSRQDKRLKRRKYTMLKKAAHRINDLIHKATRQIANAFPNAKAYVGKSFNDAARKISRVQAQQVSSACNAKLIDLLHYKLFGAIEIDEAYSSQTCPVCGGRSQHRRTYRCTCGVVAPRDVIGATNILSLGKTGELQEHQSIPQSITYLHPMRCSSSGGHPASSLRRKPQEAAAL